MKYVEQVLQPGEKVVYATSLHWFVYLRAIQMVILAALCLIAAGMVEGLLILGVLWRRSMRSTRF